ncbi:hypothetical protein OUZ56_022890 [Daphnia magna]|uniref:Uncharacterized protein n=1 Tax=Daphnia magna TaxID=35525 RepID=A0ABR0AXT0_9CRUS|nr:hypothetical protein OUZ56_022890 [Daphnia magna]
MSKNFTSSLNNRVPTNKNAETAYNTSTCRGSQPAGPMDSNLSSLEEKLKKNDIVDYRICEAIKYHRFRHFHPSVCQQLLIAAEQLTSA